MKRELYYTQGGVLAAVSAAGIVGLFFGIPIGAGHLDKLREWQTLIGASIAVAAAIIAYSNTSRQIAATKDTVRVQRNEKALERLRGYIRSLGDFYRVYNGTRFATGRTAGVASVERLRKLCDDSPIRDAETDELMGPDGSAVALLIHTVRQMIPAQANEVLRMSGIVKGLSDEISNSLQCRRDALIAGDPVESLYSKRLVDHDKYAASVDRVLARASTAANN